MTSVIKAPASPVPATNGAVLPLVSTMPASMVGLVGAMLSYTKFCVAAGLMLPAASTSVAVKVYAVPLAFVLVNTVPLPPAKPVPLTRTATELVGEPEVRAVSGLTAQTPVLSVKTS